jgi:hypothetical protein
LAYLLLVVLVKSYLGHIWGIGDVLLEALTAKVWDWHAFILTPSSVAVASNRVQEVL